MTVVKEFLAKKSNKPQEEPLVPPAKKDAAKDAEEGRPVVVTMHTHVRRVHSPISMCIIVTTLIVLSTCTIGGMFLYRQLSHYRLHHFQKWSSIPYLPDFTPEESRPQAASMIKFLHTTEAPRRKASKLIFFKEKFDIDIKLQQYERIDVPRFQYSRGSMWIHDFVTNKTGIFDREGRRCFVMVLDRNYVLEPRPLFETITKMRAGYFDADTQTVRQYMRVLWPPLIDLKKVGVFIARDCAQTPIYMLEKVSRPVYKRSIGEKEDVFVEFAGNKIHELHIVNTNVAKPGKTVEESFLLS